MLDWWVTAALKKEDVVDLKFYSNTGYTNLSNMRHTAFFDFWGFQLPYMVIMRSGYVNNSTEIFTNSNWRTAIWFISCAQLSIRISSPSVKMTFVRQCHCMSIPTNNLSLPRIYIKLYSIKMFWIVILILSIPNWCISRYRWYVSWILPLLSLFQLA